METLTFDQPQNGYIAKTERLRVGQDSGWHLHSSGLERPGHPVTEQQLVVANGTSATLRGFVFCVANAVSRTQTYKVQSLAFNEEGNIEVEAIHWPTDAQGNSDLIDDWDTAASWNIEGAI